MNPLQDKLSSYILQRTLTNQKEQVQKLLLSGFLQHDKKTTNFNSEQLLLKLLPLIKPEQVAEVQSAIIKFFKAETTLANKSVNKAAAVIATRKMKSGAANSFAKQSRVTPAKTKRKVPTNSW